MQWFVFVLMKCYIGETFTLLHAWLQILNIPTFSPAMFASAVSSHSLGEEAFFVIVIHARRRGKDVKQ